MLPYLDLTLLAAKQVIAIMVAVILSTQMLDEKFIWNYDVPALLLISFGCAAMVFCANKTETEYTAEEIKTMLMTSRTLCFFGFCFVCILLSSLAVGLLLRRLRAFERDVDTYEGVNVLDS